MYFSIFPPPLYGFLLRWFLNLLCLLVHFLGKPVFVKGRNKDQLLSCALAFGMLLMQDKRQT